MLISWVVNRENLPSTLAKEPTTLLTDPRAPGEMFSQHNVGRVNHQEPMTMGASQNDWDKECTKTIKLSHLERFQQRSESQQAIQILNQKYKVTVDPEYMLPTGQAIFRHSFHLDFFAAVPKDPGLYVVLPPKDFEAPISWTFALDLS